MSILVRLPQLLIYGIISGSILALGGIGVSLTYSILGFSNFAHGDIMALGAYITLGLLGLFTALGVPNTPLGPLSFGGGFVLSALLAIGLTAVAVIIIDRFLFRRLRHSGPIILMMSSIGLALGLRNVLQFAWGPQPHYYIERIQVALPIPGIPARIKSDEIFIVLMALVIITLVHLFLRYTKMGKAMRAMADNVSLARVTGINTDRVIALTWVIGGGLAAMAGIFAGIENKFITPELGWQMLLSIFAGVILGGIGNPYGAIIGGLIIGISEEVSTAFISTGYKPAVAFVIMILMLLVRPTGILGRSD
ncbi:branched-chain amino acid ABC transporter permease [Candidatus Bipolaricaulota bacterium]|nr:branched-chain amino acid ABC transporter permease [Candidatus Bipolaricaulota bacterium]